MADLVNKRRFSSTLDLDLYDTIDRYSNDTDIPKSKILVRALEEYFEKRNVEIKEGK